MFWVCLAEAKQKSCADLRAYTAAIRNSLHGFVFVLLIPSDDPQVEAETRPETLV